jgi:hypothetical protein
MSKTVRLETSVTYLVWQEVVLPDEFDTRDVVAMEQLFSNMPYPDTPERHSGRAGITKRIAWLAGRACYLRFDVD